MQHSNAGVWASILNIIFTFSAHAGDSAIADLSLDSLQNIEVTSVSKQAEPSFNAAAAVFVLTGDDIRRSGATSIPEALRHVPGIEVARMDSNRWAISSRGFNREFANKLLVLVDGRSVYTPLFSGTFWDAQDMVLEDIDRIEVIRGPGASLWGSNAVNGVINIITKSAQYTQGSYFSASAGTFDHGILEARHGGRIGEDTFFRVSGKHTQTASTELADGTNNNDDASFSTVTGHMEWAPDNDNQVSVLFGAHKGAHDRRFVFTGLPSPLNGKEEMEGFNILSRWEHSRDKQNIKLQAYADYSSRNTDFILDQENVTLDLDFQHDVELNDRANIIWGLGYRYFADDLVSNTDTGIAYLDYTPDDSHNNLYSAFIQGKLALIPDELDLTLGSKFEHNFYTGYETQPSARISWRPTQEQTVWAAVSRAIRIPSRGERSITLVQAAVAPGIFVTAQGQNTFKAEVMNAFELGYRIEPFNWLMLDVAGFINEYDDVRSFEPSGLIIPILNNNSASTKGIEISGRISLDRDTTFFANYSYLDYEVNSAPGIFDPFTPLEPGTSAENAASLSLRHNINRDLDFDVNLFYKDKLQTFGIEEQLRLDTRFAWRPTDNIEMSVLGTNLLDDSHQEFSNAFFSSASEVPRAVLLRVAVSN